MGWQLNPALMQGGWSWAVSYLQGNPITSKIWSQTNVIAFSGEGRCVQGSILVIANTNVGPIAVNALFSEGEDGCKESSILWDRAGDLIEHWLIQDRIR